MSTSTLKVSSPSQTSNLTKQEWEAVEWLKCRKSPLYYISNYVRIQDRNNLRTIPFILFDYQIELIKVILANQFTICGKARQLGFTWTVEALISWLLHFYENAKVLHFSKNEDDTYLLLDKLRFINNSLPDFLRLKSDPDQRGEIGYPLMGSSAKGYASTPDAGRSTDATWVFSDEAEFHPCAEANFGSVLPTIGKGKNTKYIIGSTADTEKPDTFFKKKFIGAMNGSNEFKYIFLPANSRPDISPEQLEKEMNAVPPHKKQGEYPMTIDDMLTIVKTRKYFDASVLATMRLAAINTKPIKHELSDRLPTIKIWKLPLVGRNYCVVTDPSDGKEDPHATIVMDSVTSECVASSHGKLPADQVAVVHDSLVRLYNNALNTYELNARAGGMFSEKMKALNTPNQCDYLGSNLLLDSKRGKGWYTFPKINQDTFLPLLEESVRMGQIMIYDIDCIDEFNQYFVPEGGVARHPEGGHDDYINAWARALFLRRFIRKEASQPFSFKYKE